MFAATASLATASETTIEPGRIALNTPVRQSVTYKNTDPRNPVRIEKVETSCECLHIFDRWSAGAPKTTDGVSCF